jgi:hypothetical protein
MSVLSRFVAFAPVAWPPAARFVRGLAVAAGIIAMALAAAAASPAWAENPRKLAQPPKKAAAAPDLNADGSVPDRVVKAGAQTKVAIVWDCALPNLAPVVSARVEHGTVSIRTGNGPNCGRPLMSLTSVFYTSTLDFKGTDKLYILGFLTHGDIDQIYTILVK